MAGQLKYTLEDFQKACIKFRDVLLRLPIIGIEDTLQYMTLRPGIRYKEAVGTISAQAQFAPYKINRRADADLNVDHRVLETHFGSVVLDFEPNSALSTFLGLGATKGDGQMQTPSAMNLLALVAESLSENLGAAIWKAKYNSTGDTSMDLFDGFDTITEAEITAEKISASKKNYIKLTEKITAANALDVAKEILYNLDPRLRAQECNLYCSQDFADKYNEAMLLTHGGINFYNAYGQDTVEGSNGRLHIVPLFNKADSKFFHVAPRSNMLVGVDQMGDVESVMVKEYAPFTLTYVATMFFGTQFESIDPRRLMVIELADEDDNENDGGNATNGGSQTASSGKVATPTFSPESWSEGESLEVTIESDTDGADIYYTTDGSTPTAESTAYDASSKPSLSATTTIKAIAVKDGMTDSDVATKSYTKP